MSAKPVVSALKSYIEPYRVDGSKAFHLKAHDTDASGGLHKETGKKIIEANRRRLQELQEKLYAQDRWSLLLIFQGMDAAGKDSAIESVFDGINPQGCEVHAFKTPSSNELDHDFMWRHTIALPQRGRIGIFNRSYYEECLVVRVHPDILGKQKIPAELVTKDIWRERFEDITAFEKYLTRNGTVVLKFFLNVSKEEQRERFLDRLEEPAKNWKFSTADIAERALWDKYQEAYEDLIKNTSCAEAPWHVVPADRKWFSRVVIGSAIVNALEKLDLHFPIVDGEAKKDFTLIREALEKEGPPREREDVVKKVAKKKVAKKKVAKKKAAKKVILSTASRRTSPRRPREGGDP